MGSSDFTFVKTYKPHLAMLFIQFVYAGMALLSKASISGGMSPSIFVVYRQVIATVALAPFAYFFERKKAPPLSCILLCKIFVISLFGITLSLNLYYVALNYTSATFAAATTNTIPAITFVMAAALRMESISTRHYGVAKVFGSIICISGAFVVALYKGPPVKFTRGNSSIHRDAQKSSTITDYSKITTVKGSIIMLAANTAWSMWLVVQAPVIQSYPAKLHLTTMQCLFSSIQSAVLAVIFERKPSAWKLGWDIHLISVTYCGIVVTGISYWFQVWCIAKKGPVFTSMFTPLALLIAAIFSAIVWKEKIHWGSCAGAVLLVVGLYCILWGKQKEESRSDKKDYGQNILGDNNTVVDECSSTTHPS